MERRGEAPLPFVSVNPLSLPAAGNYEISTNSPGFGECAKPCFTTIQQTWLLAVSPACFVVVAAIPEQNRVGAGQLLSGKMPFLLVCLGIPQQK